ncbi:tRNA (guanosine(46)-N7)-methyltransferase TrmB [Marivibrio halodurans]|uniref:tRNA (guanine-N(7)-)-methyltransferase n=1 Tax=Marivibrio halodurans TaxID=2039722 RepID=A0A8J7S7F1_9PROT|nr:tRNA (guanosine(46)-N7)-methyltransferase TrmB [Marivibrio halodurans]
MSGDDTRPAAGRPDPSRPKFFGRRKGKGLKPTQQRLLSEALPRFRLSTDAPVGDPSACFDAEVRAVWLEIGFGAGEHLLAQARANPDIGLIGCEPFVNGVAKVLQAVEAEPELGNRLRLFDDDARLLLRALPEASIDRLFILFPDPWPKRRHWMRRIVGPETIPAFARVLKPGGLMRLATDHPGYLDWMLFHLTVDRAGRASFDWLDEGPSDWSRREDDWPGTRYEQKALAGVPTYLRFRRR